MFRGNEGPKGKETSKDEAEYAGVRSQVRLGEGKNWIGDGQQSRKKIRHRGQQGKSQH